jgi:WD40 repeat protein
VAFSPDGALLAAPGPDGTARLWDRAGGAELAVLAGAQPAGRTHAVAWSPAGQRVAVASGGSVLLWDVGDPRQPRLVGQPATAGTPHPGVPEGLSLSFSHDGRRLAVGDTPGRTVAVFDAATGRPVWSQRLDSPGTPALAFSPDGATLAVGYGTLAGGVVEFRDAATGAVRRTLQTPSGGGVEFLRGGSVVVTTSDSGRSTAGRSIVQLWDAATLAPIGEPLPQPYGAYSLARSPDGAAAVAGTSEGAATIWDVDTGRWAATACRIAGRNLTRAEWDRHLPGEPYRRTCPQWPDGP